jgi:hypothetical protein
VTENGISAYLTFDAGDQIRRAGQAGITMGGGRVRAGRCRSRRRAKERRKSAGSMNFARTRASDDGGVLRTSDGVGRWNSNRGPSVLCQSKRSAGNRQLLLAHRQASAGISLDDPFMLPVRIRKFR